MRKEAVLWDIPIRSNLSWGWLKLLHIRDLVRPFAWTKIGNGVNTDANGGLSRFSVTKVWEAIRPRGTHVDWFRIIWFSHAIPRHSFNLWLIMRNSLKTQDRMRQWDVGNDVDLNLLRCASCETQQDSHTHLFFECPFSAKVWNYMRSLARMELVPPVL
ncbi:homeodomain-like protein [Tanacetum coccineum]